MVDKIKIIALKKPYSGNVNGFNRVQNIFIGTKRSPAAVLAGLGHLSSFVTIFSYVEGMFSQGDTDYLTERFDKIENQLDEVKSIIIDVKNSIYERGVSHLLLHHYYFCFTVIPCNICTLIWSIFNINDLFYFNVKIPCSFHLIIIVIPSISCGIIVLYTVPI